MYPIAIKAIFGESLLKVQSWGWAILCWVQNMMGRSCYALMRNECINPQMWRYPFLRSYQWDPEFRTGKHMPGLVTSAVFPCKHMNMIRFFFASILKQNIFYFNLSSSFLWCLKPEFVLVNAPSPIDQSFLLHTISGYRKGTTSPKSTVYCCQNGPSYVTLSQPHKRLHLIE